MLNYAIFAHYPPLSGSNFTILIEPCKIYKINNYSGANYCQFILIAHKADFCYFLCRPEQCEAPL